MKLCFCCQVEIGSDCLTARGAAAHSLLDTGVASAPHRRKLSGPLPTRLIGGRAQRAPDLPMSAAGATVLMVDRNPEPRGRLRRRSEVVQRETADVDLAGNEDVANEDKPERGLPGGELFAEVLEMKLRRL